MNRLDNRNNYKYYESSKNPIKVYTFGQFDSLSTFHPTIIKDSNLSDSLNMIRRKDGLWENRKGYQQFGESFGELGVNSLKFWRKSGGERYLTAISGGDIYSYAENVTYNDGAFTERGNIYTITGVNVPEDQSDVKCDFGVYRDKLIITQNINVPVISSDNSTFTKAGAGSIQARYIEVANDYVSYTGITNDRSLMSAADPIPLNPEIINVDNDVSVDIDNGEVITGHVAMGSNIIVYKDNSAYVYSIADPRLDQLDYSGGSQSNRGILRTELNEVLATGRQGIFSIKKTQIGSNQLFGAPESVLIDSLYKTINNFSEVNGHYDVTNNLALWTAPTQNGVFTFIKHMNFKDSWTYFTGINSSHWTTYYDKDDKPHILFGDKSSGRVFEMFKGRTDNGSAIKSIMQSKIVDLDQPGTQKDILYMDLELYMSKNANWTLELFKNDEESVPFLTKTISLTGEEQDLGLNAIGEEPLGSLPLGGFVSNDDDLSVFPVFRRVMIQSQARNIQWRLTNNQKNARVIFKTARIYFSYGAEDIIDDANII